MADDPNSNSQLTFILTCIPTALSILAGLWTCYNCSKLPVSTNASLKFILAIIIFDLGLSSTHLLEIFHEFGFSSVCKAEAYLRPIFYTGNFILAMLMGILSYKALANGETFDQDNFFRKSLFGTFIMSVWLVYVFCFSGLYMVFQEHSTSTICHLQKEAGLSNTQRLIATIFLNNAFLIGVGLVVLTIIYILITRIMNQMQISMTGKTGSQTLKLMLFPTLQILIALPGIIFHALNYPDLQWLQIMYVITQHSVGLVNALVFGLQMRSYSSRLHKKSQFFFRVSSDSVSSANEL